MTPSVDFGNQYLSLVVDLGGVLESMRVPQYWCKFSRRDFSVHQYVTLLVLRAKERKSYRDFCEWLAVSSTVTVLLGLPRIPNFSTLQKAAARLPPDLLERVMARIAQAVVGESCTVGIDGSGFSLDHSSRYYCQRIKRKDHNRNYLKTSITGDMQTQVILGSRLRLKRRHDNLDYVPLLRKTQRRVRIDAVVADKGYDSESNHAFTQLELNADAIIPPKHSEVPPERTHGAIRQQLKQEFPHETYAQRNKIETIFSVLKRCYGETIHSRKHRTKKNELHFKLIAYNLRRQHHYAHQK